MSFFTDNIRAGASGATDYEIEKSLRFDQEDSTRLEISNSSNGDRQKWTWSAWVKFTKPQLSDGSQVLFGFAMTGSNREAFYYGTHEQLSYQLRIGNSTKCLVNTDMKFEDYNAWYHIVLRIDTANGTSSNRLRIYVNGIERSLNTYTTMVQNEVTFINSTTTHYIGEGSGGGNLSAYMAEVNFIDGQSLPPGNFGETDSDTNQWNPIKYGGSYGTNGFYLKFTDNSGTTASTLGKDYSGNGNNVTPSNFSVANDGTNDVLDDTPSLNYPTFNRHAAPRQSGGSVTYSQGNLKIVTSTSNSDFNRYPQAYATFGATSGKWYCEFKFLAMGSGGVGIANVGDFGYENGSNPYTGLAPTAKVITNTGELRGNNNDQAGFSPSFTTNDIIGVALDLDNNKIYWHKNGTYVNSANPSNGTNGTTIVSVASAGGGEYVFTVGADNFSACTAEVNFGQRAFSYSIPTGFQKLNSQNLPTPTIKKGLDHMDSLFWAGNDTNRSITGLSFSPDWVWVKKRSGGSARSHQLFDILRGAQMTLHSDGGGTSHSNNNRLSSFDSNGFSIGTSGGDDGINPSGGNMVAWCWDGGSSSVSNSNGSITSTVRANPTAGFSIVRYQSGGNNETVGHGLGVEPEMIIIKNEDANGDWMVYGKGSQLSMGDNDGLNLNNSDAKFTSGSNSFIKDVSSTTFTIGTSGLVTGSGDDFICYCFSSVPGYSKVGTYTGVDNDDGTFVYTGFRTNWVMVKSTTHGEHWNIPVFTSRENPAKANTSASVKTLSPNLNNAERTMDDNPAIQFHSNGFKILTSDGNYNRGSGTFLYLAFGETPFQFARSR